MNLCGVRFVCVCVRYVSLCCDSEGFFICMCVAFGVLVLGVWFVYGCGREFVACCVNGL